MSRPSRPRRSAADPVEALAEELSTITDTTPAAVRARALEAVRHVAEADMGLFYALGEVDGATCLVEWQALGEQRRGHAMMEPRLGRAWPSVSMMRPGNPDPRATSSFLESAALWSKKELDHSEAWRQLVLAPGFSDQTRLLVYDGDRFIGLIAALRVRGGPRFGRRERARLQTLVGSVSTLLVTADALTRESLASDPAYVVATPDGSVENASGSAKAWLDQPGFAASLRQRVRAFDRGDRDTLLGIGRAATRIVRLDGARVRYLVPLRYAPAPRLQKIARVRARYALTAREAEVLTLLAGGEPNKAIASELGCSERTIEVHVSRILDKVGVDSRAALLARLAADAEAD